MKRLDETAVSVLSAVCSNPALSPEQRRRNSRWLVEIRKQVDRARIRASQQSGVAK